jgi:GDSL-like Lipase/Acylhydrolase family
MIARLLLVLGLLLPLTPALASSNNNLAAAPIGRMDLSWWKHRFEHSLARNHQGPVGLVWLGDSITQNWELAMPAPYADYVPVWNRFYGDRAAINLGFTGDTTASVIWRLDHGEVDGISPRAVVLLIGANNLGRAHWDARQTVGGIEAITAILHRKLPQAKVLLLGVLPSHRTPWASAQTAIINADLATAYHDSDFVTYMDVGHVLMKNGQIDGDLYLDPKFSKLSAALLIPSHPQVAHMVVPGVLLHPDAFGMARIAAAIEPHLHRMLNDRDHLAVQASR